LLIHRDIKPSNILVDGSGQPKLLDFGIAKLLDEPGDQTNTVDRLLTPNYASPEQLRGTDGATATDVYSLGAVLYKMVTGRSPRDGATASDVPPARQLKPGLPVDVDYILRKALRTEPSERYTSVEALAGDIQAFLDWRPVNARSGDSWYRMRRFLRRYRVPVASTLLVVLALSAGLYAVNRERTIAERRFQQVRQLANKVLSLDKVMRELPGSTKVRQEIVAISQEYLAGLESDARGDTELERELGNAYFVLAQAQGVPTTPNLGMYGQAKESLVKAETLLGSAWRSSERDRTLLLTLAEISEARMILADADRDDDQALAHAHQAAERLERYLAVGDASGLEMDRAAATFINVALLHKNQHRYDESVQYARRGIDLSGSTTYGQEYRSNALSLIADSLRFSGDLNGALQAIRDARKNIEGLNSNDSIQMINRYNVVWREGLILGGDDQVSLDRYDEAAASLQEAFDIIETMAKNDPHDAAGRIRFASVGRDLGNLLRDRQPQRALAVYNHALRRLREVKNNARARRGEAQLMAASSYVLRRLNRVDVARLQLDGALQLLRETKDYPADRISPGDETESVLHAWADHLAAAGEPVRAAGIYQELLDKIMPSKPDPKNNLRHAASLSRIYANLDALHRRNGRPELAQSSAAQRVELWRHWVRKLPQTPYVRRQLEAASSGNK
jgi:tetratricopeptide (TPR) repeat protein